MKLRLVLLIAGFLGSLPILSAQRLNKVFLFGYDAGSGTQMLDFRVNPPSMKSYKEKYKSTLYFKSNSIAVTDDQDSLLMYTNGCEYADGNDQLRISKDSFDFGFNYDYCFEGLHMFQQNLLLPYNKDNSYIIYKNLTRIVHPNDIEFYCTHQYVCNITNDFELGLVQKTVQDTFTPGFLNACRSKDGGWWVIDRIFESNTYFSYKLRNGNVEQSHYQTIGEKINPDGEWGVSCFSADGGKYAFTNYLDGVFLFNFDRDSGLLSNPVRLLVNIKDSAKYPYGVAFSANNRYMYVTANRALYQFDMKAQDIASSKILIDTLTQEQLYACDKYKVSSTNFFRPFLAPDCRIYIASFNGHNCLHVIENPDFPGKLCNFKINALEFPYFSLYTVPTFINDMLDIGPYCDSTILFPVSVEELNVGALNELKVFPNPASYKLNLSVPMISSSIFPATFTLHDMLGRTVLTSSLQYGTEDIDITSISEGLYIWNLGSGGQIYGQGKLVVER